MENGFGAWLSVFLSSLRISQTQPGKVDFKMFSKRSASVLDPLSVSSSDSNQAMPVRALFISDVHLGSPHCCPEEFLNLLLSFQPQRLYLVGDILDGRRLKKRWRWPPVYSQILSRLSQMMTAGTQLYYTPGNHDEFMREHLADLPLFLDASRVFIQDEFLYESLQGARLLVTHGDQFDRHEQAAGWVSRLVTVTYDWLLKVDNLQTKLVPARKRRATAHRLKSRLRTIQRFLQEFEDAAVKYAERGGYDGVICGHVHHPKVISRNSISYCNTGDWIESCSALIEYQTGSWELAYFQPNKGFSSQEILSASRFWQAAVPGENIAVSFLKSNRWIHRHSFPDQQPRQDHRTTRNKFELTSDDCQYS